MKLTKADIVDLDIKSLAYGGMGIAIYNNIVIFVKGAIPGEKVKAKIYKKKKKYLEAYVVEKIKPSKNVVIGVGITEKTISNLRSADGLVVGSAICREITRSLKDRQNPVTNVSKLVRKLKNKII